MKYDIIFCSINSKYAHSSLAPWYLYTSIKSELPHIKQYVYENTINADFDTVLANLLELDTKVYSFCCYIWNINYVLKLTGAIKNVKNDVIILLGGPEVSYNPNEVLIRNNSVDYIICGEGEEPIVDFLRMVILDESISRISGLCSRKVTSPPHISDKKPVNPYCDEFFNKLNGRITYIESTRGCPYSCAFCLSGRCGGVRFFPLKETFSNIVKLGNSGTKTIKFVDRTFNADYKRSNEILKFIIENSGKTFPDDVCFHFEIAGDILRDETFLILESAPKGLIQFEIGLQTFNEATLQYINRKTDIPKLVSNIKRLLAIGNIHIHIDLIAGLPYEDLLTFRNTFNIAYNLKADMLQLGFLKLLHGTPMREEPDKYPCNFSKVAPYQVKSTPWISAEELSKIEMCEDALERLYNSGRFLSVLDYLIDKLGLNPFELFCSFGAETIKKQGISLDEYTALFYNWICKQFDIDEKIISDLFTIDRLASNSSGKLPDFLKNYCEGYGLIKKYLKENNHNVGFAILHNKKVVFQKKSTPISRNGRYELAVYDLKDVLCVIAENDG